MILKRSSVRRLSWKAYSSNSAGDQKTLKVLRDQKTLRLCGDQKTLRLCGDQKTLKVVWGSENSEGCVGIRKL